MKLIGLLLGGFIALTLAGGVVIGLVAGAADGPRQSFKLINTGDEKRSVTFEGIDADGTLSDTWFIDEEVPPGGSVIERIPEGKYRITVWGEDGNSVSTTDFEFSLPVEGESNYQLYRFDVAIDKVFVVMNLNALYEGNSFAEHMSEAVGTNSSQLSVEAEYAGGQPFLVPQKFADRTFVDLKETVPRKVKYGEVVYRLMCYPKELDQNEVPAFLQSQLASADR
ncbi:MAG: hypothetical protein AB8G99_08015 [Planctomycetaceae bacterium]